LVVHDGCGELRKVRSTFWRSPVTCCYCCWLGIMAACVAGEHPVEAGAVRALGLAHQREPGL
jgi:hypothetical protein